MPSKTNNEEDHKILSNFKEIKMSQILHVLKGPNFTYLDTDDISFG